MHIYPLWEIAQYQIRIRIRKNTVHDHSHNCIKWWLRFYDSHKLGRFSLKVICVYFGFVLLRTVIEVKTRPIAFFMRAFSALTNLQVFYSSCHSSSDWLIVLDLAFVVIGQSVFFGFDLKTIS